MTTKIEEAQNELKRAYLLMKTGHALEAIEACQKAADLAPDHHLPPTLEGAFLIAIGRIKPALGHLRKVLRKHPEEPLPRIHFAEACFLDGRTKRGFDELDEAEKLDTSGEHSETIQLVRETFRGFEGKEDPKPLVVPD